MNSLITDEKDDIIGVQQETRKLINLIVGLIFCAFGLFITFTNLSYLRSAAWWLGVPLTYLFISSIAQLFIRLFYSPQHMTIRHDTLTIKMFFKTDISLSVMQINKIEYRSIFIPIVEAGGWLYCQQKNVKYFLAKPFYPNFDKFVSEIKKINSQCIIDERIMVWKGPYSAI